MNKLIDRFGKLITASFFVMGIGVLLFLLTPLLYTRSNFDSDLPGVLLAIIGLFIFTIGYIRREKFTKENPAKLKIDLLIIVAVILGVPILFVIGSLIYFFIAGKPLGE
jgi:drug/metabolite transporter (DMT)-like permease